MDARLCEEIEPVFDAPALPHTLAEQVTQKMRYQRVFFGLLYSFPDDDIAQLIDKLRYIKFLAEQREQAGNSITHRAGRSLRKGRSQKAERTV